MNDPWVVFWFLPPILLLPVGAWFPELNKLTALPYAIVWLIWLGAAYRHIRQRFTKRFAWLPDND